jgi:4-amino-4-deoxy-L-arabinose transferase-like glycosyltransferase
MSKQKMVGYLLSLCCVVYLYLPNYVRDGMFIDGLWYATISNNLANGIGTFWQPVFTLTLFPEFFEHPPGMFILQSVFFRLFGSGYEVERIYAFLILLITIILLFCLWAMLFRNERSYRSLFFVPLFFFFIIETNYISYPNNLLETTMSVFTLSAVLSMGISYNYRNSLNYLLLVLGSFFVFLAVFVKGPVGLFPLLYPLFHRIAYRKMNWVPATRELLVVFFGFSLFLTMAFMHPPIREMYINYFENQVIAALSGARTENIRSTHFHIIERLFMQSLIPIAIVAIILIVSYLKKNHTSIQLKRNTILVILIWASATFPLMVTNKQASYYLVPALPFFSFGLAMLVLEPVKRWYGLWHEGMRYAKATWWALVILSIIGVFYVLSIAGTIDKRDLKTLSDVYSVGFQTGSSQIIGLQAENFEHSVHGYFMRYFFVSCDTAVTGNHPFLLVENKIDTMDILFYEKVPLETYRFNLYKKVID